ncbi:hypothetical protein C2E23DRAFT_721878 [Lenzites betulinus]|nr:hypothetical protein C2E23DRAFT_721878 [Lenzites betulinus]
MHNTDGRSQANGLRSDQILSSLHPEDLSRSLAAANPHTVLLPPLPHIPRVPQKQQNKKVIRRPSTASSAEDKHNLLPPLQPMGDLPSAAGSPLSESSSLGARVWSPAPRASQSPLSAPVPAPAHTHLNDAALQEMNRRAYEAVEGLRAEASRLAGTGTCSVPVAWIRPEPLIVCPVSRTFPNAPQ